MIKSKLAMAIVAAMAVGSVSAYAQDTHGAAPSSQQRNQKAEQTPDTGNAKNLQAVTVTGSRIRGVDVETAQPVFTITQADIQKTGLTTVGDILQNITIAGAPTFSKSSVLLANTEQGGQYINLYNLGENRTLVLVNGKRWMTSLQGFTDLSTIPASLIDHIDVLKDGASAIYGSDAIAGVVNIILKDRYQGAEFNGSMGRNQQVGDGSQQAYSFTMGNTTDKSSLVFAATFNKTEPVWASSRRLTRFQYGPDFGMLGLSGTGPWGRFSNGGKTYVLNHTGSWDGQGVGADSRNLANYHGGVTTDDRFDPTLQMMEQLPSQLKSIFTRGTYNITDNITFSATGMYAERNSSTQVAGYPFNSAALVEGLNPMVKLSGDSYYNPIPGTDLNVVRRTIELPRTSNESSKSLHFDAGFNGEFMVGQNPWDWDVGFDYNKYDVNTRLSGNLNLPNLQSALGPSFLNSAGVVQCGTAAAPIALSSCVPFDILGGPSASTAAALKYINALEQETMQSINKEFSANITGGLFDMPFNAGTFSFAAGIDHRDISGYNTPDSMAAQGYTTDLVSGPTSGGYSLNEAYVEFSAPVLKDLPGVKELSFDVASRYSHYSNFGSTTNNKFSLQYVPFDDLKVRATFAKGFRAPTISDLYGGGSQSFDHYTDPCDANPNIGFLSNTTVAKNCAAAGLSPTSFHQLDTAGQPVTIRDSQSTTPFWINTGNTALQPEHSITRTMGLVYSPHYVEGLNFTLDYYDILIRNVVTGISADYTLTQCYQYAVQAFCNQFGRDAQGQVVGLHEGTANLGWMKTSGYTFGMNYRLPQYSFGQFVVTLDANYLHEYTTESAPGAQAINYAGQWSYPRWRANLGVDWKLGNWGATWGLRYYGAFLDQCFDSTDHCNMPNYNSVNWGYGTGADRIGAVVMNDIQGRYSLPWNASVAVGMRDMFNKHPPITFNVSNNSSTYLDPMLDLGRYIYVQYNQKF
ncbi:TonB-dependent receptor [Rhodanobacter sp. PCA2]|nr:TonB-dependent receptor [Rhodanobacter sp. PCA2]